jgi:hypothetical protein
MGVPNYTMAMIQIHRMGVVNSLHQTSKKSSEDDTITNTLPLHTLSIHGFTPPSTTLLPKEQMQLTKTPTFE